MADHLREARRIKAEMLAWIGGPCTFPWICEVCEVEPFCRACIQLEEDSLEWDEFWKTLKPED